MSGAEMARRPVVQRRIGGAQIALPQQTLLLAEINHVIHFSQEQGLFVTSLTTCRNTLFEIEILTLCVCITFFQ